MKRILAAITVVGGLFAVVFLGGPALGLWSYSFWAPKFESARREVFVETTSYVLGKQQFLSRLYRDWQEADPGHRQAICDLARHEAITIDPRHIPSNLQNWECVK